LSEPASQKGTELFDASAGQRSILCDLADHALEFEGKSVDTFRITPRACAVMLLRYTVSKRLPEDIKQQADLSFSCSKARKMQL
jgi:hypothetical protein